MVKIEQTKDKELLDEILRQLKSNDNYCPCALSHTSETKCMCKKFRDIINKNEVGTYECACGRYIVTITEN